MKIHIWVLAEDSMSAGTEAQVFTSRAFYEARLMEIMRESDHDDAEFAKILDDERYSVSDRWEYYEDNIKPPLTTYFYEDMDIGISPPIEVLTATHGLFLLVQTMGAMGGISPDVKKWVETIQGFLLESPTVPVSSSSEPDKMR